MPGLFGWLNPNNDSKDGHDTTPADVQARLADGERIYLLDVREPHEFREAHVPDSVLVPLGHLSMKMGDLPWDKPLVAICRSGNRSGVATGMLKQAGFAQVQNLKGGVIAWARSGGELKRGK
jgi:rhodanese-related sulfurtransferase